MAKTADEQARRVSTRVEKQIKAAEADAKTKARLFAQATQKQSDDAEKVKLIAKAALPKIQEQVHSARRVLSNFRINDINSGANDGCQQVFDELTILQAICLEIVGDPTKNKLPEQLSSTKAINALIGSSKKAIGLVNHMLNVLPSSV